jgi:hypothetical protein
MTIAVASAGRAAATAQAPVTAVVMVVASRLDGTALDPLCALRATTFTPVPVTVGRSATERRTEPAPAGLPRLGNQGGASVLRSYRGKQDL